MPQAIFDPSTGEEDDGEDAGGTVQINWHDLQPVLTLDFHPVSRRLATGGGDHDIKIWVVASDESEEKLPTASYVSSLSSHSSAVNVLRFSPSGENLGSGADGGGIILWKLQSTDDGEAWKVHKSLFCIIWDANKGVVQQMLEGHLHYVQGVAWDPLGQYIASLSSDRTCMCKYSSEVINTAYILSRRDLSRPAIQLPGASKAIVAVRFVLLFSPSWFSIRRFIQASLPSCFAVATFNSLYVYDTESAAPILIRWSTLCIITDIAWSPDLYLALSCCPEGTVTPPPVLAKNSTLRMKEEENVACEHAKPKADSMDVDVDATKAKTEANPMSVEVTHTSVSPEECIQ
ncbi:hypothetical protein ZWY2020_003303 [Hordeum vulgare]|nr:hypothetical protein ZWY2020_003303 [Hordeum vulgare]